MSGLEDKLGVRTPLFTSCGRATASAQLHLNLTEVSGNLKTYINHWHQSVAVAVQTLWRFID